jgi:hypothetical protein
VPNDVIMRVEEMTNNMHDDALIELEDQEIDMMNNITNNEGVQDDTEQTSIESEHLDMSAKERIVEELEPENLVEEGIIKEVEPEVINEIEDEMEKDALPEDDKENEKENIGNDSGSNSMTTRYNLRPNRTPNYFTPICIFVCASCKCTKMGG